MLLLFVLGGTTSAFAYDEEDKFVATLVDGSLSASDPTIHIRFCYYDDNYFNSYVNSDILILVNDYCIGSLTSYNKTTSTSQVGSMCKSVRNDYTVTAVWKGSYKDDCSYYSNLYLTFDQAYAGQEFKIELKCNFVPNGDSSRSNSEKFTVKMPANAIAGSNPEVKSVGPYSAIFRAGLNAAAESNTKLITTYTNGEGVLRHVNTNCYYKLPVPEAWTHSGDDFYYNNGLSTYYNNFDTKVTKLDGRKQLEDDITVPSNFKVTEMKVRAYAVNYSNKSIVLDGWDVIRLPHYIRPCNIQIETNNWTRSVNLNWKTTYIYNDQLRDVGKWVICRSADGNNWDVLKIINCNGRDQNYSLQVPSDEKLEYDLAYKYRISFVPDEWIKAQGSLENDNFETNFYADDLSEVESAAFNREFKINLLTEIANNKVTLKWETPAIGVNNKTFDIYRSTDEESIYNVVAHQDAVLGQSKYSWSEEFTDVTRTYYYYVGIKDIMGTNFTSGDPIGATSDKHTKFLTMDATKGIYDGSVRLKWSVDQVGDRNTQYRVCRRGCGAQEADSQDEWTELYTCAGTATNYTFTDQNATNGVFYEYKVESWTPKTSDPTKRFGLEQITDFGFPTHSGQVSGTVTFEGGTAVDSVRVTLKPVSEDGEDIKTYALRVDGKDGGLVWETTNAKIQKYFERQWTTQFFINPQEDNSKYAEILEIGNFKFCTSQYVADKDRYTLYVMDGNAQHLVSGLSLPIKEYTSLTLAYNNGTLKIYAINDSGDIDNPIVQTATVEGLTMDLAKTTGICFGGSYNTEKAVGFKGYLDDIRVFGTKCLSEREVMSYYDHMLSGKEPKLVAYWPMDEGLDVQEEVYDYSLTAGDPNNNHARIRIGNSLLQSGVLPSENLLALRALTDENGNYTINGIPYFNGGSTYRVIPNKGIHDFEPASVTRYFSKAATVFNGTDFKDKSSFPVSGVVYYEGTNYPVEGASILVDGSAATRDNAIITTDTNGKFEINVPIGMHAITMDMEGHTFSNGGRYPAATGQKHLFDREVTGLTFWDNTTVTLAGRIAGGDHEYKKPVGFDSSINNIGQAVITLTANAKLNARQEVNGAHVEFVDNEEEVILNCPSDFVNSQATIGAGTKSNTITIKTDMSSGEFAVKLPPVNYTVESIKIPSNESISLLQSGVVETLDMTDPLIYYTDSLTTQKDVLNFQYNKKYNKAYHSTPSLDIVQRGFNDASLNVAYGDTIAYFVGQKDILNEKGETMHAEDSIEIRLVTIENGVPKYKFGYPVFADQLKRYEYDVRGYEMYTNYDDKTNIKVDKVPLDSVIVTFSNEMTSDNYIKVETGELVKVVDCKLSLDENGCGVYAFETGYPRVSAPYTLNWNVTYSVAGVNYKWKAPGLTDGQFQGYVLGQKTNGSNFVTAGPDKLAMILRDPPGSASSMTWSKGTSHTTNNKRTVTWNLGGGDKVKFRTGHESWEGVVGVPGAIMIKKIETWIEGDVHATIDHTWTNGHNYKTTYTTNAAISTSSNNSFDGTPADLYIGHGTNFLFGEAQDVQIYKNENGEFEIGCKEVMTLGESIGTYFAYTEYYIEETLIPNFKQLRNQMILPMGSSEVNDKPYYRYVSKVAKDNSRFGEEDAYIAIPPRKELLAKNAQPIDSVNHYNQQIKRWQSYIAQNEEAKVKCINNRGEYLVDNYSVSSGGGMSYAYTTSNDTTQIDIDQQKELLETDWTIKKGFFGIVGSHTINIHSSNSVDWNDDVTDGHSETFSYNLNVGGTENALSIDCFKAPDKFSRIFVTRGGQTSGNWEPQRVTKYYKPGTEIMAETQKNYVPKIYCKDGDTRVNVPTNRPAQFHLQVANESPTGCTGLFLFRLLPDGNDGGCDVKINGGAFIGGTNLYLTPGKPVDLMVEVRCLDMDARDCDLKFVLVDTSQSDPRGPYPVNNCVQTVHVSFVPGASDISLAMDHPILNGESDKKVRFTVSDYDLSLESIRHIGIQYRPEGDVNWHEISEAKWRCSKLDTETDGEVITDASVEYILNMQDALTFPDNTYYFRAYAVNQYGTETLYGYSDELVLTKDVQEPLQMGNFSPANGTYSYNSEVSVNFNEDIVASELSLINGDVTLLAETNEVVNKQQHPVSLKFDGSNYARSEANVYASEGSMTVDMWVKAESDGNLMALGTENNNMAFGIDEGKLYAHIGNQTVMSDVDMPLNDWVFLSMNLNRDNPDAARLNVTCATTKDNAEIKLINDAEIFESFNTSANIYFGHNFKGYMHDVTVWDTSRSWEVANSEKWAEKNQFTTHLVAYWPFTDGHGTIAEEKVSAYNLVLSDANSWALQSENYALRLDKENYALVNAAMVGSDDNTDYLVQMWFRADKNNTEDAEIFSLGNDKTRVCISGTDGSLTFESFSYLHYVSESITTDDLRDEKWHHISMQVRKSQNANAVIYLDGEKMTQMSASMVANLDQDLTLGKNFAGYFDDVRLWKGYYSSDIICDSRYVRLNAESSEVGGYYPMEESTLGDGNQLVMSGTLKNMGVVENTPDMTIWTGEGNAAVKVNVDNLLSTEIAPQQKDAPVLRDVKFNLVTSERKVLLDITEDPAKIEGCKLFAKVKNVKDLAGNVAETVAWSFTVDHRFVEWLNQGISAMIDKTYDASDVHTFAAVRNNTGNEQNWTLSGCPDWMEPSATSGVLGANEEFSFDFVIKDNIGIGTHAGNIYLVESNGISHKLPYNIVVMKDVPEWVVNGASYKNSMNIYGVVVKANVVQENPNSIIAAFDAKDNCVGVAQPAYYPRYDAYYILMTIYGNEKQETPLRFRYYDASTGTIHPDVYCPHEVGFVPDSVVGSMKQPFEWYPTNKIEQKVPIAYGWSWISFNVLLDGEGAATEKVFDNTAAEEEYGWNQFNEVVNEDQVAVYEDGAWYGDLKTIKNGTMYKVNANNTFPIVKVGLPMSEQRQEIPIHNGWNWLGANVTNEMTLTQALASMHPQNDDVVKSKDKVAIFSEGAWDGTLSGITPGVGYFYKNTGAAKGFTYPSSASVSVNGSKSVIMKAPAAPGASAPATSYDYSEYTGTMVVVAVVENNGKALADCSLYALDAKGEVRGYKTSIDEDGSHLIYMVVHGNDLEDISFRAVVGHGDEAQTYELSEMLSFADGDRYGKPSAPYVFSLDATGINGISDDSDAEEIYTTSGIRVARATVPGVYISNGKKVVKK